MHKLYEADSYRKTFEATVLEVFTQEGQTFLVLDQTAFYPLGGGQESDRGIIDQVPVLDVQEKQEKIYHQMAGGSFRVGQKVQGQIDWKRRFDFMQQHSGEHILSGVLENRLGTRNVGFHIGEELMRVDYDKSLSEEELRCAEREANSIVAKNLAITCGYPSDDELEANHFRYKKTIEGAIRIVNIPGVDYCACCGTHVQNTAEVGLIKIVSAEKYKGGVRLAIVCGERALSYFERLLEQNRALSQRLSAGIFELDAAVAALMREHQKKSKQLSDIQKRQVNELIERTAKQSDPFVLFTELEGKAFQDLSVGLRDKAPLVALFRETEQGFQYILTSLTEDMRELGKKLNEALQGKGGGQPLTVQGSLGADKSQIEQWLEVNL